MSRWPDASASDGEIVGWTMKNADRLYGVERLRIPLRTISAEQPDIAVLEWDGFCYHVERREFSPRPGQLTQ